MSIPIKINPLFFAMAALIGWLATSDIAVTGLWVIIILFSVLIHEFGHALTALLFKQSASIMLTVFGGVTYRTGRKLKLWQEFIIVFNGPLFSLLLSLGAIGLYSILDLPSGSVIVYILNVTAFINLYWTALNLLPVIPLDGGKLVQILLEGLLGFKGVKLATFLSMVLCILLALGVMLWWDRIIGAIFFILAFENYRAWKEVSGMTEQDKDEALWVRLNGIEAAIRNGNLDKAWENLLELDSQVKGGILRISISQMMSLVLFKKGHYQEAYKVISPLIKKLTPDFLYVAQQIAYKSEYYDEAVNIGNQAYHESPSHEVALINAYCFAKKEEPVPAVGWLRRAQNDGISNMIELLQERAFDSIRHTQEFQQLQTEYSNCL